MTTRMSKKMRLPVTLGIAMVLVTMTLSVNVAMAAPAEGRDGPLAFRLLCRLAVRLGEADGMSVDECVEALLLEANMLPAAPPASTTITSTGFPQTAAEFWTLVYRPCPTGITCLDLEVGEVSQCPGETMCWRAPREKDMNAFIMPFMGFNQTSCVQDGWMHSPVDRATLGRQAPVTAKGSGVPAGYVGLLEGITFRQCSLMVVTTTSAVTYTAPITTAIAPVVITPTKTVTDALKYYGINPAVVTTEPCPGEAGCWKVVPSVDFFQLTNPCSGWLDGYAKDAHAMRPGFSDAKVGFPPGFSGMAEVLTARAACP